MSFHLQDDQNEDSIMAEINMTPMVDVVLCLLVFFMAATKLYDWDENAFVVNVPQVAEAAPLTSAPDDLSLAILKPGLVAIGDKQYQLPELATLLKEARARYEEQGVVIRGDAKLNYQDLADALHLRRGGHPQRPAPRAAEGHPIGDAGREALTNATSPNFALGEPKAGDSIHSLPKKASIPHH